MKLFVVADGARNNWEFLKELSPNVEILDCWHSAQHLQSAFDARAVSVGFPIGSGAVEAVNKVLFTTRMKRSEQSWDATEEKKCSHSVR